MTPESVARALAHAAATGHVLQGHMRHAFRITDRDGASLQLGLASPVLSSVAVTPLSLARLSLLRSAYGSLLHAATCQSLMFPLPRNALVARRPRSDRSHVCFLYSCAGRLRLLDGRNLSAPVRRHLCSERQSS